MMRREQAERTRELLLDAAAEEFWLHGLGGTRIQDVLDRAGVTKGGLYHHFTSKLEMAQALAEGEDAAWRAALVVPPPVRGLAAVEAVALAVAARLGADVRARAVLRITEELGTPEAASPFVVWQDVVILGLQQAIADAQVPDSIPIREVAATVVEAVHGACVTPAPAARDVDAPTRVRRMWRLLEPGLRAAAAA
jgi:AcrR family transcriptional regulator